jgi:tetratricopeptide (TPR) repeat protein
MKKIVISLLTLSVFFLANTAFSQDIGKPNLNKAEAHVQDGELDLAKAHVDGYFAEPKNEKKLAKGKPWLTRAKVYAAIASTDNDEYKALVDNPLEEVNKSFAKIEELEKESSLTYVTVFGPQEKYALLTQDFQGTFMKNKLFGDFYTKGVEAFDTSFEDAIDYFEKALVIKPRDTFSIMNAISAAYALDEPDGEVIEKYSRELMDMKLRIDSTGYSGYNILSGFKFKEANDMMIAAENEADSTEALAVFEETLEVLEAGLAEFPNDDQLQMTAINTYIKLDKTEGAISQLESVVKANPDKQLYFNLGILYDRLENFEKSKVSYNKAIEMDPEYYDAYYNLGAMYFTLGNKKYAEAGEFKDMNGNFKSGEDGEKGKALEAESMVFFKEAVPSFEKVIVLDSSERQPIEVLQRIYYLLGETEKVVELKEKLDAMPDDAGNE